MKIVGRDCSYEVGFTLLHPPYVALTLRYIHSTHRNVLFGAVE